MVDSTTTLDGLAAASAARNAAILLRASGKPGDGSKVGGSKTNTPSVPSNACCNAGSSLTSASATSQPCFAHASPFAASRTTARTSWPAASSKRATTTPTCPMIPVHAYIVFYSQLHQHTMHCADFCDYMRVLLFP